MAILSSCRNLASPQVTHGRGLAGLETIAEQWRNLAFDDAAGPLVGPDWIRALVASNDLSEDFHVFSASIEGRITAVLPLLLQRGWLRGLPLQKLTSVTAPLTLRVDVVATPGQERESAISALWSALAVWPNWTVLELCPIPQGGGAEQLLAAAKGSGFPVMSEVEYRSPFLDLVAGTGAVLAATSANFRHKLRRTRRRLLEQGPLKLEFVARPQRQDLDEFFQLEASGWKGRDGGKAILRRDPQEQHFYYELASTSAAAGQCGLHRLLVGDRVIAASLGLFGRASYYAVRWCYDEQFAAFGPGHLLIESLLEECQRLGLRHFDFTGPEYAYKHDWTRTSLAHRCLTIFRPNMRGRALRRWKMLPVPGRGT